MSSHGDRRDLRRRSGRRPVAIADAVIRKLRAGEFEVASLKVQELEVARPRWTEPR